jgi:flagellar basal body rod protein FlgB
MMQTASIPDNISDVLVQIIHFTQLRRRVLHENLHHASDPGFTPKDLPVREFAEALSLAVAEHLQSRRLLFCDTANIQFGPNNAMQVQPVIDSSAGALLATNRDEYLEFQIQKLLENCLNRKVAEELLRQKNAAGTGRIDEARGKTLAGDGSLGDLPAGQDAAE